MNASLCEIRAWPKPGNINKFKKLGDTDYNDFLGAAYSFKPLWEELYRKLDKMDFGEICNKGADIYTDFLDSGVEVMISSQKGGNVLLGHLMLLTPLFIGLMAIKRIEESEKKEALWKAVESIMKNSEPRHTVKLYRAIRKAGPGGMGRIEKYDLYSETGETEVIEDGMNLYKIFNYSKNYDDIAYELSQNYLLCRKTFYPKFERLLDEYGRPTVRKMTKLAEFILDTDLEKFDHRINGLIVRLYLYILGTRPDTLIIRKNNGDKKAALEVSARAAELFEKYYRTDPAQWFAEVINFDEYLHGFGGKRNPGTTADLTATTLFIFFINNYYGFIPWK